MQAFFQNVISFELLYSYFYEQIAKLHIYKNSAVYLSDWRETVKFFCKIQEVRNPSN